MNNTQNTAFKQHLESGGINKNQEIVLKYIKKHPGFTSRQLAGVINSNGESMFNESVSGSLSSLFQQGLVLKGIDPVKCPISGKNVTAWFANTELVRMTFQGKVREFNPEIDKKPKAELTGENIVEAEAMLQFMKDTEVPNNLKANFFQFIATQFALGREEINWDDIKTKISMYKHMAKEGHKNG